MPKRTLTCTAALVLSLGATHAMAIGLGEARVLSRIGEPLLVEIDALLDAGWEAGDFSARLAPESAYRSLGAEYVPVLAGARTRIETRNGRNFIRLGTVPAFGEPWVSVIIDFAGPSGSLRRRYDLLVDPLDPAAPVEAAMPARMEAPAASRWTEAAPKPVAAPKPAQASIPVAAPIPGPVAQAAAVPKPAIKATPGYTTRPGDSLSAILARSGCPGPRMREAIELVARANPQAFIDGNPDRMLAGVGLDLASLDRVLEEGRRAGQSGSPRGLNSRAAKLPPPEPLQDPDRQTLGEMADALQRRVDELKARLGAMDAEVGDLEKRQREALAAVTQAEGRLRGLPSPVANAQAAERVAPPAPFEAPSVAMYLASFLGGLCIALGITARRRRLERAEDRTDAVPVRAVPARVAVATASSPAAPSAAQSLKEVGLSSLDFLKYTAGRLAGRGGRRDNG